MTGPSILIQTELEDLRDSISSADDSYDGEIEYASKGQCKLMAMTLQYAVGYMPRKWRVATLACLAGYDPERLRSSEQFTKRGATAFIKWAYDGEVVPGSRPREGALEAIIYASIEAKDKDVHSIRKKLWLQLMRENGNKPCPFDGLPVSDMHEIIRSPLPCNKYGNRIPRRKLEEWEGKAKVYYKPTLCVVVSNQFNLFEADGRRDDLLRMNMDRYGEEAVVADLRALAEVIDPYHTGIASTYIPYSLDHNGHTVQILEWS